MNSTGTANLFSVSDANSSYWQIKRDKNNKDETVFVTIDGLYRYTRTPFWSKEAPATFQQAVGTILAPVKWQHALMYKDDVFMFSKRPEEHLNHVESAMQLINKVEMTLKL